MNCLFINKAPYACCINLKTVGCVMRISNIIKYISNRVKGA